MRNKITQDKYDKLWNVVNNMEIKEQSYLLSFLYGRMSALGNETFITELEEVIELHFPQYPVRLDQVSKEIADVIDGLHSKVSS